ncbi:sigma-54 interaction domain-containing protein [Proteocatella sphenisci]|uniref:sigma-54 interaction domain-containing protein n=1 Tax=Proteocatella sphenisci TaxID=181070 RepID=UPI0004B83DE3|nr:sigma 54-interacting transcriptional regulator [Proteocatella sphenisci]
MIENYYDIINNIENFFDGVMIVDENCIIRYNKSFAEEFHFSLIDPIGKTPWEVWENLNTENSTCYRAVKYGESAINQIQKLKYVDGSEHMMLDNTFPIKENGKIIGAVSISKFIDNYPTKSFIDLSNMTSTYKDENGMYNIHSIIGSSELIEKLKYKIQKVSQSNSSVLIYGETGTGKELIAQSIHSHSPRRSRPFITQNCAAIPHTLLESIFFGTTKGSYTGAENRPGIFELADGGSIFLDEINSMDINMQAKLLKAIEEKKITRIGGIESKQTDVRIIAAINEIPEDCVKENRMRKDLYYRLSGIEIEAPPLRDRKSDIEELSKHFISLYNTEMHKNIKKVSPEVTELFLEYNWPGNVREFKNIIESAFNFSDSSVITKEDVPKIVKKTKEMSSNQNSWSKNCEKPESALHEEDSLKTATEIFEKEFIMAKSKKAPNLSKLADLMQISRQTLNYKLKKYNMDMRE